MMQRWSVAALILIFASTAAAELSVNVGYDNPVGARPGANLMYLWTDWAGEIGFGYLKVGASDKGDNSLLLVGDINAKYFFLAAPLRPYAQIGTNFGNSVNPKAINIGLAESWFAGAGLFLDASGFYAYGSYNVGTMLPFFQAGLGIGL